MEEHGSAENTEYDVDFPADVGECRGDEVGECEVEDPVCGGGEGYGFAADAEGVELWWIDPGDGSVVLLVLWRVFGWEGVLCLPPSWSV